MLIGLSIVTITITLCSYLIKKDWLNPIFLFNLVWSIILTLFNMQLFKTIEISNTTIGILYCMIFSFNIGAFIYPSIHKKNKNKELEIEKNKKMILNEKLFLIFVSISVIVMLIDEIWIITNLISGMSFKSIMSITNGKETVQISGAIKVLLYMFIVHPMNYIVSPICAIQVIKNKKKKYLIINVIVALLALAHHGGRISLFLMLVSYLTVYYFKSKQFKKEKKRKISLKNKIILFLGIISFILFFIKVSSSRGINDIWLSFYAYLICCIPLSTIYTGTYIADFIGKTGGMVSFNGITYPIFSFLNYFKIESPNLYDNALKVLQIIENEYVNIGNYNSTGINNYISAGTYAYVDGGFVFEVFLFIILGYFIYKLYNKCCISMSDKYLAIYCLCIIGIVLSFMSLLLTSYSFTIGLLIVSILLFKPIKSNYYLKEGEERYEKYIKESLEMPKKT